MITWAQTVDFRLNSPGVRLNAPEVSAFGLQIKKQLETKQLKAPAQVAGAPIIDVRKSIFVTDENPVGWVSVRGILKTASQDDCRWPGTTWSIWLLSLPSRARFCSPFSLPIIFAGAPVAFEFDFHLRLPAPVGTSVVWR